MSADDPEVTHKEKRSSHVSLGLGAAVGDHGGENGHGDGLPDGGEEHQGPTAETVNQWQGNERAEPVSETVEALQQCSVS